MNKQYIVDRLIKKAQLKNIPIMGTLSLTPQESQFSLKCPSQNLCTLEEWIKLANEMQKHQVLFLELSGEPLLHPQFQDLYLALKNLGMVITIHTNAIMIDEEIALFLGKYKPKCVNVTLYGSNQAHYQQYFDNDSAFQNAMNGIRLLKKYGINVIIQNGPNCTSDYQIKQLTTMSQQFQIPFHISKQFTLSQTLSPIQAARLKIEEIKSKMDEESFKELVNQKLSILQQQQHHHKQSCLAGKCAFFIDYNGMMSACSTIRYPSYDVLNIGFQSIWTKIVKETELKRQLSPCRQCILFNNCETCYSCPLCQNKTQNTPLYMCQYSKETLRIFQKEQRS